MPIPSSSNRGVLGRIGSGQGTGAVVPAVNSPSAFIMANSIPPLGWLGVFNTGRYLTFVDSVTFTAPVTGYYRVRVLGGGGCGALIAGDYGRATGGGGGGFAMGLVWLTQGQTVSITVGKGGVAAAGGQPGGAGGTSSFGAYLSATGGAGGSCAISGALIGALGGVGAGGSLINASGGKSGAIETSGGYSATGGGGAGSQLGTGGDAGSISGSVLAYCATGGGGLGFPHDQIGLSIGAIISTTVPRSLVETSGHAFEVTRVSQDSS